MIKWLEMKTRIKMPSKDWHHGYLLNDKGGTAAYAWLPRVPLKKR